MNKRKLKESKRDYNYKRLRIKQYSERNDAAVTIQKYFRGHTVRIAEYTEYLKLSILVMFKVGQGLEIDNVFDKELWHQLITKSINQLNYKKTALYQIWITSKKKITAEKCIEFIYSDENNSF